MKTINILDSNTIDKIAAGEVVERPLNAAKELIENAIDAGSSFITVEIKDGGISYLRVTDNGEGIDRSQIRNAFMRHATSKIKSIEDLLNVSSLGFRGEALSSISSVSKVEILTKTKEELLGTRYVVEGGRECVFDDAGLPEGTTVIVRDLFYNIPARLKFLKSAHTEGSYITELIEHMILSHPDVSFKYIMNGNVKLQSSGNGDIKGCIYTVYGRDMASSLIEINDERDDISIHGFIGKPELSRGTKSLEIYFVNSRFIKSSIIEKALDEAYKKYLMLHKYPVVFLYFDIPGYLIDVNVHPAKKEIRFIEAESIKQFIEDAVKAALDSKELIPEVVNKSGSSAADSGNFDSASAKSDTKAINPEPFEKSKLEATKINSAQLLFEEETAGGYNTINGDESINNINYDAADCRIEDINYAADNGLIDDVHVVKEKDIYYPSNNHKDILNTSKRAGTTGSSDTAEPADRPTGQLSLFEDSFLSTEAVKKHRIIGQLFDTYWLIEYDNKLYIIDQHAAHEKVNYERLIKKIRDNEVSSQLLYPPIVITLSNSEADFIERYIDNFNNIGFEIENFGGREYTISAVPMELLSADPKEYFIEMIDGLLSDKFSNETDIINQKIASMACKASVKANMKLNLIEAEALISELLSLDNPYNCPHGRPTIVSYSKYELEKMFKRVVN